MLKGAMAYREKNAVRRFWGRNSDVKGITLEAVSVHWPDGDRGHSLALR